MYPCVFARGDSAEARRGDAVGAAWIFREDGDRGDAVAVQRGYSVETRRGDAVMATPWLQRRCSVKTGTAATPWQCSVDIPRRRDRAATTFEAAPRAGRKNVHLGASSGRPGDGAYYELHRSK